MEMTISKQRQQCIEGSPHYTKRNISMDELLIRLILIEGFYRAKVIDFFTINC